MSIDIESRLRVFFASSPRTIHPIQTLEISHSAMTRRRFLWHEPYPGTVALETGEVVATEPTNFEVTLAGSPANLDQSFTIKIDTVDIDDEFHDEMDLIPLDSEEMVVLTYREYLSDDLRVSQSEATLQLEAISYAVGAATMTASSPRLNIGTTGETYNPRDVPMLRGLL